MSTSGYGAAADHQALTGLTAGDPHTQYARSDQGLLAARPAQPVRAGFTYYATDAGAYYRSDGGTWVLLGPSIDTNAYPSTRQFARLFLARG